MLAEARTFYGTPRAEFYQVERRATALEAEVEKLREDLELSRETNRGLESTRLELTDEINALRAHAAELEFARDHPMAGAERGSAHAAGAARCRRKAHH
ncbi:MAG: hypothetical protein ACM3Z4_18420, partial [Hyphomicrobiales bacterium]